MVPLWDPGNGALLSVTEKEKVSEKEFMRNGYLSRKGSGQRGDLTCRQKKKGEKERKERKGWRRRVGCSEAKRGRESTRGRTEP